MVEKAEPWKAQSGLLAIAFCHNILFGSLLLGSWLRLLGWRYALLSFLIFGSSSSYLCQYIIKLKRCS
jgi:hypothetical protein